MRLSRHRTATPIGINMTPMIDIVFLLIIFFMTVSQITRVIEHPVELPVVKRGGADPEPITITVNIDRDGKYFVAGQEYSLADVMLLVGKSLLRVQNDPSLVKILVRCDRQSPSRYVNQLVDELVELNLSQVRLSVRGER